MVKRREAVGSARVWHAQLWGGRAEKLAALRGSHVGTTRWTEVPRDAKWRFFHPESLQSSSNYENFLPLTRIFRQYVSGVQSKRDALFVDPSRGALEERMRAFLAAPHATLAQLRGSGQTLPPEDCRWAERARGREFAVGCLQPYLVAPFDRRWIYFDPALLGRPRLPLMGQMLQENLALVFMRQSTNAGSYDHFLAVRHLVSDRVFYSGHGAPYLAPLYVWEQGQAQPNLHPEVIDCLQRRLGLELVPPGRGDGPTTCDPRDVLHYLYAVVHLPDYRQRYAARLQCDFPRVPLVNELSLFWELCGWGERLVTLHTHTEPVERPQSLQCDILLPTCGYPKYCPTLASEPRLYLTANTFLPGIRPEAWDYRVGGYQVLARWLRCRRGRSLSPADAAVLESLAEMLARSAELVRQFSPLGRRALGE